MKRILVWDIPTRLFHWLLAAAFFTAFAIAQLVDDDSEAFKLHMLFGGLAAFMVLLRVLWGLVGSRWSRFASFAFGPGAVVGYFKGLFSGTGEHHVGHNPGASWGIFAMLAMTLGLAVTGANMATGGEVVEELHEILAYVMIATVGAHIAGVVLHTLRHRENIVRSMLDGYKQGDPKDAIASAQVVVGIIFLALTGAVGYGLVRGYDASTGYVTLPLVGTRVQLGDEDGEAKGGGAHKREGGHDQHEDD